jgi:hypothetical protein
MNVALFTAIDAGLGPATAAGSDSLGDASALPRALGRTPVAVGARRARFRSAPAASPGLSTLPAAASCWPSSSCSTMSAAVGKGSRCRASAPPRALGRTPVAVRGCAWESSPWGWPSAPLRARFPLAPALACRAGRDWMAQALGVEARRNLIGARKITVIDQRPLLAFSDVVWGAPLPTRPLATRRRLPEVTHLVVLRHRRGHLAAPLLQSGADPGAPTPGVGRRRRGGCAFRRRLLLPAAQAGTGWHMPWELKLWKFGET